MAAVPRGQGVPGRRERGNGSYGNRADGRSGQRLEEPPGHAEQHRVHDVLRHAGGGAWIKGRQSAQVGHTNQRVPFQGPYHPIMLSPSRAVILANAGFSKRDAQEWLHERCRVSLQDAIRAGAPTDENGKWLAHPELQHLADDPDAMIPALEDPEQYLLWVTGGSTHYANFFYGTYGIATMPVEDVR